MSSSPSDGQEGRVTLKQIDRRLRRIEKMFSEASNLGAESAPKCPECSSPPDKEGEVSFAKRSYKQYGCGEGHVWVAEE